MWKNWMILGLGFLSAACAPERTGEKAAESQEPSAAVELGPDAVAAAKVITAEVLRGPIAELSSDEYHGRGPGSDGDTKTQRYLADEMGRLGFEPGGTDGSWVQPFEIVGIESKAPDKWTFHRNGESRDLDWWDDYIASSGVQEAVAEIEDAELVFVGYGIQAPEYDWDDFAETDVTGKVLVIMNNDPDWDDELFEGNRRLYYGRWDYKYEKAAAMGAVGAIIIHTTPSAGYPFQVVQTSWTGTQFELPAGDEPRLQIAAWTTEEAIAELLAFAGHDLDELRQAATSRDFEPLALGIVTSLRLENDLQKSETANVLGVLPGSDPELANEYVVYSAHHDHLGVGEPNDEGDTIYNGAKDNGAGTSSVLAIGRAFAELPERPRRSILLAFVAAEEQGLLGSEYYALNPTVPAGRLAANINYDGGNIWGRTKDVTYIGYGKSSLDEVVEKFAAEQGRTVKPDQFADRGYFYRSDQFNFAKAGVPAIYFDEGTDFVGRPPEWGRQVIDAWTEIHYHQPSDELTEEWNFDGMVEDTVLGFRCGLYLAQQDEMPSWNPGDEFEPARLAALEALD
jgi:Zn-dependent M28 family amino/carboxypeptidase